eukprot:CAMPEP_0197436394 /NCGR_PEP_ID=MMETSP1175-20131217/3847_1 /TAXON_ID=1003142 /ORGANISM="Triceratium dubium, Strain CCMP147" /LENGTH=89 /DNA_ID=CAMNT_0042965665 /DNA_START=622 /DNA_END=891 /DNA_ORIENTATION=+
MKEHLAPGGQGFQKSKSFDVKRWGPFKHLTVRVAMAGVKVSTQGAPLVPCPRDRIIVVLPGVRYALPELIERNGTFFPPGDGLSLDEGG